MAEKTSGKRTDDGRSLNPQIGFVIPKGNRKILQDFADDYGISITELILRAVEKKHGVRLPRSRD